MHIDTTDVGRVEVQIMVFGIVAVACIAIGLAFYCSGAFLKLFSDLISPALNYDMEKAYITPPRLLMNLGVVLCCVDVSLLVALLAVYRRVKALHCFWCGEL